MSSVKRTQVELLRLGWRGELRLPSGVRAHGIKPGTAASPSSTPVTISRVTAAPMRVVLGHGP